MYNLLPLALSGVEYSVAVHNAPFAPCVSRPTMDPTEISKNIRSEHRNRPDNPSLPSTSSTAPMYVVGMSVSHHGTDEEKEETKRCNITTLEVCHVHGRPNF